MLRYIPARILFVSTLIVSALNLSGCSFLLVQEPMQATPPSRCTTSQLGPILDSQVAIGSAMTSVAGLGGALATSRRATRTRRATGPNAGAWAAFGFGAVLATVTTYAATRGFKKVRWCRSYLTHQAIRQSRRDTRPTPPRRRSPREATPKNDNAADPGETEPQGSDASTPDDNQPDCKTAGSPICSDDSDCLSGDVCHPNKRRCVSQRCVGD